MSFKQVGHDLVPLNIDEISELEKMQLEAEANAFNDRAALIREKRTSLLSDCDWIVMKSFEQSQVESVEMKIPLAWLEYRQSLRDITDQAGFPHEVIWPTKP